MTSLIHFFALADTYSTWLFCGEFREGDGWTALPQGVTCPECRRRVEGFREAAPPPAATRVDPPR